MATAFHGGAFWEKIGDDFQTLDRRAEVINADVLDAWFDPAPAVIEAVAIASGWVCRTSPPTHASGVVNALSLSLGLERESILVGAGSSALIYLALGQWLGSSSRVLVAEPAYGEYAHYCDQVARCRCDRFALCPERRFCHDLTLWLERLQERKYDLAVLVNPNNPTGQVLDPRELRGVLSEVPSHTRVLVDEAYLDYVGVGSIASFAASAHNVFVVKSLSKVFGLSGLRAAFMVGATDSLEPLRARTPPWAVSLPAQIAAVAALGESEYYHARYRDTELLRDQLSRGLLNLGFEKQFGTANWLLCELPEAMGSSADLVARAQAEGLFLRDAGATARSLGNRWVRIAVKDLPTQEKMLAILQGCLQPGDRSLYAKGVA